ncbi:MAG TPA: protein kinase [Gemmatimonadales bacterium]|nr:protein kinase [Gemmatimonadales bacterium]
MPGFTTAFLLEGLVNDCPRCHTPLPVDSLFCSTCPPDSDRQLRFRLAHALEGRYEIIRLLGRGGMAAVFLARDLVLEREVAIKVLPPEMTRDRQLVARFQQEAKTAARLDHPNIIPIHRVENEGGLVYIVMKYVSGQSLEETLSRGPLPIAQVRHVLREAALALGHAHRRHIVHRDVKPANIMVDEDGRVVLTDFGISKAVQGTTQITGTGTIIGTPHYMSPEQAKGRDVDGRTDQYALGIVGYRALTGTHPFEGDAQSILYQQVHEAPPSILKRRPETPPDLRMALDRALSKNASARFPTMEEFASWVNGEHAASIPSATTTVVSAPAKTVSRTAPASGQGAGIYVAMGTVLAVIALAFVGIPRLQTAVEGRAARSEAVAADAEVRRAPAKKYVSLTVRSIPRAMLYVDGVKVGLTPVTGKRLSPGTHYLRLQQRGYHTVTETIVVKGSRPIQRQYQLRKNSGR